MALQCGPAVLSTFWALQLSSYATLPTEGESLSRGAAPRPHSRGGLSQMRRQQGQLFRVVLELMASYDQPHLWSLHRVQPSRAIHVSKDASKGVVWILTLG